MLLALAAPASASFPGENGRIVFQSNRHGGPPEVYSMNPDGTGISRLTWNTVADQLPRVSPDGSRIVFARTVAGNDQDVWIMDIDGTGERRLTSGSARDDAPVFTPDGEHVVFQRVAAPQLCPCELRIIGADGSGERQLDTGPGIATNPDVSKNGKLAFASDRDGTLSIYVGNLKGGPVKRVTEGPAAFGDFRPRWSPRGNDLVFMRNETGTLASLDVWRVHQDGTGLRRLTMTPQVEEHPQWSPDGKRIVFSLLEPVAPFGGRLHTIDADDGGDERALPQMAAPLVDGFHDDRVDTSVWHSIVTGTHAAIAETGGEVVATIDGAAEPGGPFGAIDAHLGSQCSLPGDYDMQIAYRLLEWPPANGVQVALNAYFAGAFVLRESKPWGEQVGGWIPPTFGAAPASDLGGTLRLVRSAGVVTAFVLRDGEWLPLASGANPGEAVFGFSASAFAEWSHQDVRVAFDDFRLSSGELACPTWWRDAAPDWAAVP